MKSFLAFLTGLLLFAFDTGAITVIPRNFDELVERADTVFKGSVTAVTPQWIGEGETRRIVTFVTFRVEETYKGEVNATQTLRFLGGIVEGVTMTVPDMPVFTVGQSAVLFVTGNGKQYCPLVGIHQGRFHVAKDQAGIERITTDDGSPVIETSELGQFDADGVPILRRHALAGAQGMTLDSFKTEVLGKVAVPPDQKPAQRKGLEK